ncbi:DUF427 domain-containing protein [Denitrobaculum tricleocarpae]|uniref:DUF427 domain-containing protein n=1 Tax=Denitrobaculum tricleocarpae TaxID=2591009 RepID=A0A545T085_9PROT|nr:DUF427 domain-containing protein [Denitrobaculum tricleocarpae]TQV70633.1 DUF427 domain-containing protein [Denitrobaculum tricleocarpae]
MFKRPLRVVPGPGQESVWDYPRPPRIEKVTDRLIVTFAGQTVAETTEGYRVLETSHPPVYYFPPDNVREDFLVPEAGRSFCEFKGPANYWSLEVGEARSQQAAWNYPETTQPFRKIQGFYAFYASRVEACWVGDEQVQSQEGDFYGGWITGNIVGPFKGAPGTRGW